MRSRMFSFVFLLCLFCAQAAAQEDYKAKVQTSIKTLKEKLNALGTPKLKGIMTIGDKSNVPVLYFGNENISLNEKIVDEVQALHGGSATVFVKKGVGEYIRVSTNIKKSDNTRAVGTRLGEKDGKIDPANPALQAIGAGKPYYGVAFILNANYETGYEPITDASGKIIGVYYVGYLKK